MENIRTVAAIVIYNKRLEDSITYRRLRSFCDIEIDMLVIDNSEIPTGNEEFCKIAGIKYISMNGNAGLSKAYNVAINESSNADMIIFFDDDTEITEEYFRKLNEAERNNPDADIFAPIIYGQDGVIYSPNEFNFLKNHFIENPKQKISQKSFNAIASCLAVRMRVFDDYRFNEKLFVDQVDQYFFCEQRKLDRNFCKLNTTIQQNFHQRDKILEPQVAWNRLRLRIIDIMTHARLMGETKYYLLAFIKNIGLSFQIGIKSKSPVVTFKALCLSVKVLFKKNMHH